jgi:phage baseplate assembly protein gpV
MSAVVPLIEAVTRRELAAHRTLSLGVVTEARTNQGGSGDHHLDVDEQLHGTSMVLQRIPVVAGRVGFSAVPRTGDLVVLGFLDGDVNGAVVLGVIHDADTPSPDAAPDEVVYEVPDASGGARRLELQLPNGNTVTVKDSEVRIVMGGTSIVVEGDGGIALDAAADITLKAQGALNLEAGTTATVKGVSVTVEASGTAKLKGATTTIAGTTSFSAG